MFLWIASISLFIFSLIYQYIYSLAQNDINMDEIIPYVGNILDHSYTISIFLNGLQDQSFVLPIYWELNKKHQQRWSRL